MLASDGFSFIGPVDLLFSEPANKVESVREQKYRNRSASIEICQFHARIVKAWKLVSFLLLRSFGTKVEMLRNW